MFYGIQDNSDVHNKNIMSYIFVENLKKIYF